MSSEEAGYLLHVPCFVKEVMESLAFRKLRDCHRIWISVTFDKVQEALCLHEIVQLPQSAA